MTSPEDVLADPGLLAGWTPDEIEPLIASSDGWPVEALRRGSRRDLGWLLSSRQRALLAALDEQLAAMSGQAHADLWSRDALRTAPAWAAVRKLTGDALAAFHAGARARR